MDKKTPNVSLGCPPTSPDAPPVEPNVVQVVESMPSTTLVLPASDPNHFFEHQTTEDFLILVESAPLIGESSLEASFVPGTWVSSGSIDGNPGSLDEPSRR